MDVDPNPIVKGGIDDVHFGGDAAASSVEVVAADGVEEGDGEYSDGMFDSSTAFSFC